MSRFPKNLINGRGNDVTDAFLTYARPLISPLPEYVSLEEIQ